MACHTAVCLSQQCIWISGRLGSKEKHQNYDNYVSCLQLLLQKAHNNHNIATMFTSVFSKCTSVRKVHVLVLNYQLRVDRRLMLTKCSHTACFVQHKYYSSSLKSRQSALSACLAPFQHALGNSGFSLLIVMQSFKGSHVERHTLRGPVFTSLLDSFWMTWHPMQGHD